MERGVGEGEGGKMKDRNGGYMRRKGGTRGETGIRQ